MRRWRTYYGLRHFIDSGAAPLQDRPTRQASVGAIFRFSRRLRNCATRVDQLPTYAGHETGETPGRWRIRNREIAQSCARDHINVDTARPWRPELRNRERPRGRGG